HMTGIAGPIGAAVAAGRLLHLNHQQLQAAVGLAATQSAGVLESLGAMAKSLQPGKAAAGGFEAAVLAAQGLDGPAAPIEGRRGLLALHAGSVDGAASALGGLGERWELERNEIKPYACGVVGHSVVDIARAAGGQAANQQLPRAVRLRVHPFVLVAMGRTAPQDSLEAKFSVTHCFAVGYLRGAAGPAQFRDDVVHAPDVVALRERCELIGDPAMPRYGARAEITDADGQTRHEQQDHPARLDSHRVRRKAITVTEPILGDRAEAFAALAFDLASVGAMRDLMAAGAPTA
ncbi:MAG: MmgE/PrpD family protein, partial [Micromonosporaceae bacterium]